MTTLNDRIALAEPGTSMPPDVPHPRPILFTIDVDERSLSETVPHVNNIVYVAWLDRVAELAGGVFGHDRAHLVELGRMWFVARQEIDYLAEAFTGDRIVAATWIHDARRSSCRRDTLLHRFEDDQPIARARTTWTWIDLQKRRPCRMPEEVTRHLDPLHTSTTAETRG